MTASTTYKFQLDTSSKKITCPCCGQKTGVRYFNNETNDFFPNNVCRCDRENSCGYHYTPKQYLNDIGQGYTSMVSSKVTEELKPEIIDYMPLEYIQKSMTGFDESNFASWLINLFGQEIAKKALIKYFVGRSRIDNGRANIFWRIDKDGNLRTGKIMQYSTVTGKRNKEAITTWVHTQKKPSGEYLFAQPFNFKLCFFGEHLIKEYPDKTIAIVESEKTAIVASIFMPDMVWVATGGNSGCKWREWSVFNVLKDRNVLLFPDFGYYNKKSLKTCFEEWNDRATAIMQRMNCKIIMSRVLEDYFPDSERMDQDLADLLIVQENGKGPALTDDNYPVIFDFYKLNREEITDLIKQYGNN